MIRLPLPPNLGPDPPDPRRTSGSLSTSDRRNHYLPRTARGWTALVAFLGLMALVQPPIAFWVEARMRSGWLFGIPSFFVYLGVVYFAMIGVLVWAAVRRL